MIISKTTSESNILIRKNEILQRKLTSTRINSACIRKNSTKYALFRDERRKFPKAKEIDIRQQSAVLKYNPVSLNPVSSMHQMDKKLQAREEREIRYETGERKQSQSKISQLRQKDLRQFSSTKAGYYKGYKQNLKEYFTENKVYERLFFKHYYRREKEYFVPKLAWNYIYKKPNEADQYQNQVLKKIIQEEEQKKKQENKKQLISKKILEMKEEDRQERQYKKELLEKFVAGEQLYFDQLEGIAKKSGKLFEGKLVLKGTYHFDNILRPENQFVCYKDLNYQRGQLIEFESKQQSFHSKLPNQDEQLSVDEIEENMDQEQLPIDEDTEELEPIPQQQEPLGASIVPAINMSGIREGEIREFWLHVKTNQKQKVKFAVLIEPRLLQLVDENGMTPLHWSAYRDYNSLSKLVQWVRGEQLLYLEGIESLQVGLEGTDAERYSV